VRAVPYAAAEPIGVAALAELADAVYGDDEPLAGADAPPLLSVRRTGGDGIALDSEFELALRLPGLDRDTSLELTRIDDELAVTVGGVRRLVALPAVLCRCEVLGARVGTDLLAVLFRPDPAVWMSGVRRERCTRTAARATRGSPTSCGRSPSRRCGGWSRWWSGSARSGRTRTTRSRPAARTARYAR
jgi:arsenite-transporting ATPase